MKNSTTNEQLRQELLDKCFHLGLPADTSDDIDTLKMYLSVDSKLEDIVIDLSVEHEEETRTDLITQIMKLLPSKSRSRRPVLSEV